MDVLTESVVERLEKQGVPFDRDWLEKCISRLMCKLAPSQVNALDPNVFVEMILEIIPGMPRLSETKLDKSAGLQSPTVELAERAQKMDQDQTDQQRQADSDRHAAFKKAIEEAAQKIAQSDPEKLRLPRFERQGSSWSLTF